MEDRKILDALKHHYDESIFVTDGEGNVVFVNEVGAKRLGTTLDQIENKNVRDLVASGTYHYSTTLEAIKTQKPVFAEISRIGDDHTYSRSIPVFDENGNIALIVTSNMSDEQNKQWRGKIDKERNENDRLRRELDYLRIHERNAVIANSPQMKSILSMIDTIAPTDSNVVVLGDSGTGKDLIARIIHDKSSRSKEPFISINCAAMPENLLESELFGYEGGAFTGALSNGKIGLFEATSNGTLFLDEIGEMSLSLQSKLLRAIENKEIRRVGGITNIPINCRIICATNVDLQQMVNEKKFRDDLYYRLNVFKIKLPPLCQRREDIIPIANLFLSQLNAKYGENKVLAQVTVDTMLNYIWPGNIRELRNVIERIFVISKGHELIFTPVPTAKYEDDFTIDGSHPAHSQFDSLRTFLDAMEIAFINKTLSQCNGSISKTAETLGIHRSVLYRKIQKHKIE